MWNLKVLNAFVLPLPNFFFFFLDEEAWFLGTV